MPTYGYRCDSCGHEFEVLQKITDAPLATCPKCSGKLRKKVYATGVIFKGSGYYTTDYKNGAKSTDSDSSNGSGAGSEKASDKPAEKAAESKPAAESKAESKPSKSDSTE
jgi:putative FmdB family regulatory protein